MTGEALSFFVAGHPSPGGSKTAQVLRDRGGGVRMVNGRPLVIYRDAAKRAPAWKEAVRGAAALAMCEGPPLDGPLKLVLVFYMPRPKGHFRTNGELKPAAPAWPTVKPDCTKLVRPVEDAMTGIVWHDDAQVVVQGASKQYASGRGQAARIGVSVLVTAVA